MILDLPADVSAFLARHRMATSRFGKEAVKDASFGRAVLSGKRHPRMDTVERVYAWMKAYDEAHPVTAAVDASKAGAAVP